MILFVEIEIPLTIRIKRFLIVRQTLNTAYVNYDILVNVAQYVYQIVIFLKLYCELIALEIQHFISKIILDFVIHYVIILIFYYLYTNVSNE